MTTTVKWPKPVKGTDWNELIYTSECGRYVITKQMMSGSRNGTWRAEYLLTGEGIAPRGIYFDRLREAKEYADQ